MLLIKDLDLRLENHTQTLSVKIYINVLID